MKDIEWMPIFLGIGFMLIALSFWRAHKDRSFDFNVFDLIMVNGRVDRVALAFMLVLGVTTWLMLDLQFEGKMTEGYLTSYGAMWVAPLVMKVVFNRSDNSIVEPPATVMPTEQMPPAHTPEEPPKQ